MKLHFFGTCAGTEPMPGRKHTSFAVEIESGIYWFDAGENCSNTAHLMGVDLLAVRKIFISHTHMDHVGGLGNLFWNIRKLSGLKNQLPIEKRVDLYLPNLEIWDGIWMILKNTEGDYACQFEIGTHEVTDGVLLDQDGIRVSAIHNHHLPHTDGKPWRSFSYKIEAEGKTVVFSGDVKEVDDLAPFLWDPCDVLLIETGHHNVAPLCDRITERYPLVKSLFFIHNGKDILQNPVAAAFTAQQHFRGPVIICEDGTSISIERDSFPF
jgi:Metal-dependent hydrolases of the beta-lactamase superfamily III